MKKRGTRPLACCRRCDNNICQCVAVRSGPIHRAGTCQAVERRDYWPVAPALRDGALGVRTIGTLVPPRSDGTTDVPCPAAERRDYGSQGLGGFCTTSLRSFAPGPVLPRSLLFPQGERGQRSRYFLAAPFIVSAHRATGGRGRAQRAPGIPKNWGLATRSSWLDPPTHYELNYSGYSVADVTREPESSRVACCSARPPRQRTLP